MTLSIQLRDFTEAERTLARHDPALTLEYIGVDARGWAVWSIRRGGCIEPIGCLREPPDGLVILQLYASLK